MRLFIGIALDEATKTQLSTTTLPLHKTIDARWVDPEMYHLTLAYLGERSVEHVAVYPALLGEIAARIPHFVLTFVHVAYFQQPPKAILYQSIKPSNELSILNTLLRNSLQQAGENFDAKPFIPHITLAQNATFTKPLLTSVPFTGMFTVACLTLFHSLRVDDKLQYLPIQTYSLNNEYPRSSLA